MPMNLQPATAVIVAALALAPSAPAATIGGSLPYEVGAIDRAKIAGAVAQSHSAGTVQRRTVTVTEIYGAGARKPIRCEAGVVQVDPRDFKPGQQPELVTNVENVINVCLGH